MVAATVLLVPIIEATAATRTQDLAPQGLLDNIAELEQRVEGDPDDHETRTGLAALYTFGSAGPTTP